MPKSKILNSKKLFTGQSIELVQDYVVEPSGRSTTREVVRHPPAVVVLPMINKSDIVLIRQYRYAVDEFLWELPAGSVENGESILAAGGRELEEETGYHAGAVSELARFYSAPGFTDEQMHLILASQLTKTEAHPDSDESIECHAISREKVFAMLFGGDIIDAKTIAGLLLAKSKLNL
jgi:ADP-ribose diphosphatase